ncbi:MAG: hypothetical protein N2999_01435 [Proteobacteria bacterium]|nr:hypothetical protein [Pseudomonadota bacterium]
MQIYIYHIEPLAYNPKVVKFFYNSQNFTIIMFVILFPIAVLLIAIILELITNIVKIIATKIFNPDEPIKYTKQLFSLSNTKDLSISLLHAYKVAGKTFAIAVMTAVVIGVLDTIARQFRELDRKQD